MYMYTHGRKLYFHYNMFIFYTVMFKFLLRIHQWANGIGDDIRKAGFQITKKDELEQVCFIVLM